MRGIARGLLAAAIISMPLTVQAADRLPAHGLELPATFTGTLPCADCEGISYHLDLWPDQGYHMRRTWLGTDGQRDELGTWFVDPSRNALVLHGASEAPIAWSIEGPRTLRLLDRDGAPIVSDLPYELTGDATLTPTPLSHVFMGGMMTYMADAAIFQECMTGQTYPIAMEGDYLTLERAYVADRAQPGAPLYVHVEGGLDMRPQMEGAPRTSLIVDRFIKTRPSETCARNRAQASLANTYWRIDTVGAVDLETVPGRVEPHVLLRADGRYSATVGCNRMAGSYEATDDNLTFGPAAMTRMACRGDLGRVEEALASGLDTVASYRISAQTMILLDATGSVVATLSAVYLP